MNSETNAEDVNEELDQSSPDYWTKAFKGTPASIFIPPYIRFLQGQVTLKKALIFLRRAHLVASSGHPVLKDLLHDIEHSPDSRKTQVTYESFFSSHLVINLVSEVEHFFANAVSAALRLHPAKLGSQKFRLSEITAASSIDELVDRAASETINRLMYEKPSDYIIQLGKILSIELDGIEEYWPEFIELKARRDLGVHNNWVVNEIYLRKLREVGLEPTNLREERIIPDFDYLNGRMETCNQIVEAVAVLLANKWLRIKEESKQEESFDSDNERPET